VEANQRVLAKFRCWEKSERVATSAKVDGVEKPNATASVKLSAVKDDIFGPYTPSGNLEMQVTPTVGAIFNIGQEYYLVFEPVTPETSKNHGLA